MKKNLGAVNTLYPSPIIIVGTEIHGKINFINIALVGLIDKDTLSISMGKIHYSNQGIKENMTLSINLPSEAMVVEADYVGLVSGAKVDKSNVFEIFYGDLKGAPMIKEAPLSMECEVVDILDMPNHDVFLVRPKNTYCNEEILTNEKIDICKIKPLLFDTHFRRYLGIGAPIADCWSIGNNYKK